MDFEFDQTEHLRKMQAAFPAAVFTTIRKTTTANIAAKIF